MRPLPSPDQYGTWDVLPDDPDIQGLDMADPWVLDALERREQLKENHARYLDYPTGFWARPPENEAAQAQADAHRNDHLRTAYGAVQFMNNMLMHQAENPGHYTLVLY